MDAHTGALEELETLSKDVLHAINKNDCARAKSICDEIGVMYV